MLKYAVGLETLSDYLKLDEWNEDRIFERAEWLYEHAADIWHIEGITDEAMPETGELQEDLSDSTSNQSNNTVGATDNRKSKVHSVRRKYWEYALKYIKEAIGPGGPFQNRNTSQENWLNGYIGIPGFSITCVAKLDSAELLITLSSKDRDVNKSAFDYLLSRRDQIEKDIGAGLGWWRYDKGKASYIGYKCKEKNIGIYKENSWETMAKFHAEWSKRFNDVFVPLLREWNANQT